MAESTEGIVLRRIDYSETSLVVHFYTPDFGQVGALAKGAKRPKSAFQGGVDVLTRNQIVFARREPGGLATLMESAILDDYLPLRSDLGRLIRAQYCAELVSLLTVEEDACPPLYGLLVETLERLASGKGDAVTHTLRFEMGILAAAGYEVDWDRCVACERALTPRESAFLSSSAGGVVCARCAGSLAERAALAPGARSAARILSVGGPRAERLHLSQGQTRPLGQALSQTITYVAGRPPRMLKYVERFAASGRRKAPSRGGKEVQVGPR